MELWSSMLRNKLVAGLLCSLKYTLARWALRISQETRLFSLLGLTLTSNLTKKYSNFKRFKFKLSFLNAKCGCVFYDFQLGVAGMHAKKIYPSSGERWMFWKMDKMLTLTHVAHMHTLHLGRTQHAPSIKGLCPHKISKYVLLTQMWIKVSVSTRALRLAALAKTTRLDWDLKSDQVLYTVLDTGSRHCLISSRQSFFAADSAYQLFLMDP